MGHHAGEGDTNGGDQTEEDVKLPKTPITLLSSSPKARIKHPLETIVWCRNGPEGSRQRAKESHPRQERRKTPRRWRRGSSRRPRARQRKKLRMKNGDRG